MPPGFGRAAFSRQEFPPGGRPLLQMSGVHPDSGGAVSAGAAAMPKFIIERQVPGASRFTRDELHSISRRSVGVLRQLGPEIQWVESYVAGDNLYCVYVAPDEEMVREHGRLGGFPVNKVTEIKTVIDPTTAE
jgi:hypothetical protein